MSVEKRKGPVARNRCGCASEAIVNRLRPIGYSFDDVLIVPPPTTSILPHDTDTSTDLGKGLVLNLPLMAAAMEISESSMAIGLAREGAVAVLNPYLDPREKAWEVRKVKKSQQHFIANPYYMLESQTVADAETFMKNQNIGGMPIVESPDHLKLIGMVTQPEIAGCEDKGTYLGTIMKRRKDLIVEDFDIPVEQGLKTLRKLKLKKLPLLDSGGILRGMIVHRDPDRYVTYPKACRDRSGRLRVGAAMSMPRNLRLMVREAKLLLDAGADFLVVDASVGWSTRVAESVRILRRAFPKAYLVAGNVLTAEQTINLIRAGVDAVKLFYGPGSTCISRDKLGTGRTNFTVVLECAPVARQFGKPVIADGGFEYEGQIVKALCAGASAVMTGRMVAGTEEVPIRLQLHDEPPRNIYRGMGSHAALAQRKRSRYARGVGVKRHIAEGVEGTVLRQGKVSVIADRIKDALQRAMSALNAKRIPDLWSESITFQPITAAGRDETRQRMNP